MEELCCFKTWHKNDWIIFGQAKFSFSYVHGCTYDAKYRIYESGHMAPRYEKVELQYIK